MQWTKWEQKTSSSGLQTVQGTEHERPLSSAISKFRSESCTNLFLDWRSEEGIKNNLTLNFKVIQCKNK